MKLWIDECLSPMLVGRANEHGYAATCTRDRGYLSQRDDDQFRIAVDEGFAFVTNNRVDFWGLCKNAELHAGLIVIPQGPRDLQLRWLSLAISHIEHRASQDHEAPIDWLLNRAVEVHDGSICTDVVLSSAVADPSASIPEA